MCEMRLQAILAVNLSQRVPKGVAGRALLASVMTWQLCVRDAVLFCGLTHPEATAATRWTSFELASEMRLLPIPAADCPKRGITCRAFLVVRCLSCEGGSWLR